MSKKKKQFEVGNAVQLISGYGPELTVEHCQDDIVDLIWFDSNDNIQHCALTPKLLKLISE